jgi:hypothetical protein
LHHWKTFGGGTSCRPDILRCTERFFDPPEADLSLAILKFYLFCPDVTSGTLPQKEFLLLTYLAGLFYIENVLNRELSFLIAVSDNSRQLELRTPGRLFEFRINHAKQSLAKILFVCAQVY